MTSLKSEIKPNIFEYDDYRHFLRDTYSYLKSTSSHFSFRYFSKKAGFKSPNYLKLVIKGSRNLTDESTKKFAQALRLSKFEWEYFNLLVQFNQAKTPSQRSELAQRIVNSKGYREVHPLSPLQFAYYSSWYYVPVRELVGTPEFVEDPEWLASRLVPQITVPQARQALLDLEELGLLVRNERGELRQANQTITTENEVSSAAVVNYHKDMLELAARAIDLIDRNEREVSAACIPVSKKTAAQLKLMIQDFRKQLLCLAAQDENPEVVYQVGVQFFPLSHRGEAT